MPRDRRLNVFPSFGTDARPFAKAILGSYRGGETEAVQIFNWTGTNAIPAGRLLDSELCDLIGEADVFLALVDAGYGDETRKTRLELAHALALRHQRGGGLVIVPLLLEPAAAGVLAGWGGEGAELLGEVTSERCFDPDTGAFLLPDKHPMLHQRLVALRREHLASCRGIQEVPAPDGPAPSPRPAAPGAPLSGVVLLERAALPEDAAAPPADTPDAREAARLLREAGAEVRHVSAGWLDAGALDLAAPGAAPLTDAAFVQVLGRRGAEQAATSPDQLRHRLRAVGLDAALPRSRLVQWHPAGGERASAFDTLAARNEAPEASFRADAPAGLAGWLKGLVRLGDGRGGPVAAYQDVDDGHRAALLRELQRVARDVLPEDPDERELHPFSSDGIGDLVSRLAARKPILVVHNINQSNPVAAPGSARKQTMGFFREVASRADEALRRRQAGPEDVFWLAVLMEGNLIDAGGLRLPSGDPLLFRWRVLTCAQRGDNELALEGGARFADIGRDLKAWAGREPGLAHG